MNNLNRYGAVMVALGAFACGPVEPEPAPGDRSDATPAQRAAAQSLGAARLETGRVVLPSLLAEAGRRSLPNATAVTKALQDLDGAGTGALKTLSDGTIDGRVGQKEVRTYPDRALIVVRDDRGEDATTSVPPVESELIARARPLLTAFGVDESEMMWKLTGAGMISAAPGEAPGAPQRTSTKLYIERTVAGLPVAEDRLVVTFALDGSLRKMIGRWHPLDGRIAMQRSWTKPEIVQNALAMIQERGLAKVQTLNPDDPIDVETKLVPKHVGGGVFTLGLGGHVTITVAGPMDTRKPLQLELEL